MTKPIDREARDRAARLVEDFWGGRITNMALIEAWPSSGDPGIAAIEDFLWPFYDDFREHSVDQGLRTDADLDARIARCIKFLRSDEAYTWPRYGTLLGTCMAPRWAVLASFGLLAFWNRLARARRLQYGRAMTAHGDVEAWPFRRKPAE